MINVSALNVGNVIKCLYYKLIDLVSFLLPWSAITHVYCGAGRPLWCCHNAWKKENICKFVICNVCKEREDNERRIKLGVVRLPRDASSSGKIKTSDYNDSRSHNHITQHLRAVIDDTYFAATYLKKIVDNNFPQPTECSRCHLILSNNKEL